MDIGSGLASFGQSIAGAMDDYHKETQKYQQQLQLADALSRIAVTPQGQITQIDPANPDKTLMPIMDKKALQQFQTTNHEQMVRNQGALEAMTRMGTNLLQHGAAALQSQKIQDASLSGQRTQQIINQENTMFPLDVEQKKAQTKHLQKITDEEGKINVPGFGLMTPAQYSTHLARQERMDVLKKKSEPLLQFENQLQGAYGLGIKDIADATKPQEFTDPRGNKYKGTPFYDINGNLTSKEDAVKNPEQTFVLVGANKVPIPLFNKKTGLGWQQIAGKANNLAPKIDELLNQQTQLQQQQQKVQAQQIMALHQGKDPSALTPQDQQAIDWAKQVLGQ